MIGTILRLLAFLLFVLAAVNQTLFDQGPFDLSMWALAAWVLATVIGGWDAGGRLNR